MDSAHSGAPGTHGRGAESRQDRALGELELNAVATTLCWPRRELGAGKILALAMKMGRELWLCTRRGQHCTQNAQGHSLWARAILTREPPAANSVRS